MVIQEDGWQQAEFERSEPLDDLPRALVVFVGVRPCEVEVELVGMHLGQEVSAAGEVFEIEKLVFFEPMHGFHVALVGVRGRGYTHVLAIAESFGEITLELAAIVGCQTRSRSETP